jgi:aminopeptidase N
MAFESNNLYVRQAIALSLISIPDELKVEYESLLKDDSYVTQETALGNLWVSFPEEKSKYLNAMDGVMGFQDKNIRQFWLFLALITEDYKPEKKSDQLSELRQYTSPKYGNAIREIALEYLGYLNLWDDAALFNLIDACQHHYWRFQKSSRVILANLIEDDSFRNRLILLGKELDTTSSNFLNKMLYK